MVYGRSKAVPAPATPFEEFMATASERMTAARLEFVEFLRELPPAAWITVGAVVVLLAASSLNWRGKKEASVEPAATTNAAAAEATQAHIMGLFGKKVELPPPPPPTLVAARAKIKSSQLAPSARRDAVVCSRRSSR